MEAFFWFDHKFLIKICVFVSNIDMTRGGGGGGGEKKREKN